MTESIYNTFSEIHPLTDHDFQIIAQYLKTKSFKKGEQILDYGQIERCTKYVISGMVHQTILIDDTVFTIDISLSGMYFNNLTSYLEESPSIETQTALTDVEILYLEKNDAEKLRLENHAFCYIYSKSWEIVHYEREKRSYMLQNKSAYKRFELFMETNKNARRYLEEVPQKLIGEYLNLTAETFSRVKRDFFRQN